MNTSEYFISWLEFNSSLNQISHKSVISIDKIIVSIIYNNYLYFDHRNSFKYRFYEKERIQDCEKLLLEYFFIKTFTKGMPSVKCLLASVFFY